MFFKVHWENEIDQVFANPLEVHDNLIYNICRIHSFSNPEKKLETITVKLFKCHNLAHSGFQLLLQSGRSHRTWMVEATGVTSEEHHKLYASCFDDRRENLVAVPVVAVFCD